MVNRSGFAANLQRLYEMSEKELRAEAQAKFDKQGSLSETLQFIQDYAEIDVRAALVAYIVSDVIVSEDDSDAN